MLFWVKFERKTDLVIEIFCSDRKSLCMNVHLILQIYIYLFYIFKKLNAVFLSLEQNTTFEQIYMILIKVHKYKKYGLKIL